MCSILQQKLFNTLSSHLCVELRYLRILLCGHNSNNFSVITCVEICKLLSNPCTAVVLKPAQVIKKKGLVWNLSLNWIRLVTVMQSLVRFSGVMYYKSGGKGV